MSNAKKLGILSDVTFDLVIKEIRKDIPQHILFNKYEDITSALVLQRSALNEADFLLIHCETIFNRYETAQLSMMAQAIEAFAVQFNGTVILSGFVTFNKHNELAALPVVHTPAFSRASNILFADYASLVSNEGLKNVYHYPLGHLYQMPFTKPFIKVWSAYLRDYFRFLDRPEKKVIILDCDNTLWGGILGEDGPDKVRVNKNADGILFLHFQQWLKQKTDEGFLLCLCSKNNEADVKDFFDTGLMPLRWDDFIVKKVNWEDKYTNLTAIARELNLGTSSFIFIDDNEFEIESVKNLLPDIACIHFNVDYPGLLSLTENFLFKRKRILQVDREKQEQYKAEQQREQLKNEGSFEDYIRSLNIVTEMLVNKEEHLERFAQMTEKTNQFNFNKIVYTPSELKQYIKEGNFLLGIKVADRFGDYGIVGLIMADVHTDQSFTIHNYLMSCRALGRGVEEHFFSDVLDFLKNKGLAQRGITFVETPKNQPSKTFYERIVAQMI